MHLGECTVFIAYALYHLHRTISAVVLLMERAAAAGGLTGW